MENTAEKPNECPNLRKFKDRVCRLCLEEKSKFVHMNHVSLEKKPFSEILKDTFLIELDADNSLPQLICKQCLVLTLNFYIFKNNVIENEVFVQNANWTDQTNNQSINDNSDRSINDKENKSSSELEEKSGQFDKSSECSVCSGYYSSKTQSETICKLCNNSQYLSDQCSNSSADERTVWKGYYCINCNCTLGSLKEWKSHIKSHYIKKLYNCKDCNNSFEFESQLLLHISQHRPNN